jgi:hypothetical protein
MELTNIGFWDFFGVWVAALLTLFIFSFLYKDNPFYKFAEYLFVGISAGYYVGYYYYNVLIPNFWVPFWQQGRYEYIIAVILGITILFRMSRKSGWVSRFGFAFVIGCGAGINFITYLQSNAMAQVYGTIAPLVALAKGDNGGILFDWKNTLYNLIMIIGVTSGLVYFYFSKPHKGFLGVTARLGIWFLMVSFGASFGYTIMARISLLIGRMQFLIFDWIKMTWDVIGGKISIGF